MEPDVSIEGARMIRVAVVSVGNIPTTQLRDYVSLVLSHRRVDLRSASSFYSEHQKSPFMQQPWDTGSLWFKFLVGGAHRSPWDDFQAHRKCLGVIGLLHCPTTLDVGAAYDHFISICRAYPSAQEKRCFAFFPMDDQLDDKKREHLAIFPPNRQMLEYHMQTLMQDFAASLLMAFETTVLHADTPVGSILATPLDSQASLNSEEVSKARKRRLGRVQKSMGDYCLLAGSPADATSHYNTAVELARVTNDAFWHAGAIEGIVSALVVDHLRPRDQQMEDEVRYRYGEAIQLYHREKAMSFELEAALKLARFLCRREFSREVVDLLTGVADGSKNLMDASDRLVLNVEVARIYGDLGYERKAAFYLRQVAQLYQQQDSCWAATSALQVLSLTTMTYRIQSKAADNVKQSKFLDFSNEAAEEQVGREIKPLYTSLAVGADGQWNTLQVDILYDMLAAAVRAGDPLAAWSAAARLIRSHYPLVTPAAQHDLATALTSAAERLPSGTRCADPALPFVRLHSYAHLPMEMEVVKRIAGKKDWWVEASSTGPFIYTPSKSSDARPVSDVIWVVGEPMSVLVDLSNPCAFDVFVEGVCLSIESGLFEAFPVSIVLPPGSSQVLSLSGIPKAVGRLVVRGCFVECFGLITEHLFQDAEDHASSVTVVDPFRGIGGSRRSLTTSSDIVVVPQLPLLVAQVVGGEGAVVLYEGECRDLQVKCSNAGVVPVVEATMILTGKHKEHVLSIGHEVLNSALPLLPGETVFVPVRLKAGHPTVDVDVHGGRSVGAGSTKGLKDVAFPMLVIYYAGELGAAHIDKDRAVAHPELPPGRRLALPLRLHVLRGLDLIQARLLSMEVAAHISRSLPDPSACKTSSNDSSTFVKIDPYRGSWGLLLLELELWNATDVLFEITVDVKKGKEPAGGGGVDDGEINESFYPRTRIDQEHSARVLVPLDRFKLAGDDKASLAVKSLARKGTSNRQSFNLRDNSDKQARAELESTIEELSSRINVKWHSGRNSTGVLPLKDAIREAMQRSAIEVLLPDPLTFGFRLAKNEFPSGNLSESLAGQREQPGYQENGTKAMDTVVAHMLTPIEMLVRNNTRAALALTLSVTCRDVTGTNCLGSSGAKATVLWAGALNGVVVSIPALSEVIHTFALCFLVPGQYTLLGAAMINDANKSSAPQALTLSDGSNEPICYSGPPFTVDVSGIS